jgi:hypothetical protein
LSENGEPEAAGPTVKLDMESLLSELFTAKPHSSEPCANPFCRLSTDSKLGKKFCSSRCRMDDYVLRRARAMLVEIGAIKFNAILKTESFSTLRAIAKTALLHK